MNLLEHFVGGKLISGSSDRKGKVFNPATGEQESEVRLANKSDLDQAVEVAKKAFETWSLKPSLQRARVMFKFKELIEKNSDELTKLILSCRMVNLGSLELEYLKQEQFLFWDPHFFLLELYFHY